jgi:hypothetical protein
VLGKAKSLLFLAVVLGSTGILGGNGLFSFFSHISQGVYTLSHPRFVRTGEEVAITLNTSLVDLKSPLILTLSNSCVDSIRVPSLVQKPSRINRTKDTTSLTWPEPITEVRLLVKASTLFFFECVLIVNEVNLPIQFFIYP